MSIPLEKLLGTIQYSCPHCQAVNHISLENLENYLYVENIDIRYSSDHTHRIEFDSPKCRVCGESFISFLNS